MLPDQILDVAEQTSVKRLRLEVLDEFGAPGAGGSDEIKQSLVDALEKMPEESRAKVRLDVVDWDGAAVSYMSGRWQPHGDK